MLNLPALNELSHALAEADDDKIRKIVALTDQQPTNQAAQSILAPLRPRLAVLRPPRPLRFTRLLFLPLDPVIVPARGWRIGDATVPRGALASIAATVRAGLGAETGVIDAMIAGRDTSDTALVDQAGAWLWPRAASILGALPAPTDWDMTGLPPSAFPALANAIVSVLRRSLALREIERDTATWVPEPNDAQIARLLDGLAAESAEGLGMIVTILLARVPHAAPCLLHLVAAARGSADGRLMRDAMAHGLDHILDDMDDDTVFHRTIAHAPLRDAGHHARRVTAFLGDIDREPDAAKHRPRLKSIFAKLDQACRERFGEGLTQGVVTPLMEATGPLTATDQTDIETQLRGLRALEMAARKIGGGKEYDVMLARAADAARLAAQSGMLSRVRHMRLVELLDGPEAAEALYSPV